MALLLDELLEELVPQVEQGVLTVGGLAQCEQPRPGGSSLMTAAASTA
ncbi:hypothetical protein ACFQX6_60285 [Streptosporangium lutulentum]